MSKDSAKRFKDHVQLYVRTVFADRLRQEGFTSYRGEDIFWYRLINNEVVHSVCFVAQSASFPIALELGYACYPLFIPPFYNSKPRAWPHPGNEQLYDCIPELIPGSMPYGQQHSFIPGSLNNFGDVPNTLAMDPSYQKRVLPVLENALGVLEDIKTPRECYEIHKHWRAGEIENEVWLTTTTYFADEVLYWEDYDIYPFCKDFIHGKIAWLEAVDKKGKLRKADKAELERLYLLEKAFRDGGREEYMELLDARAQKNLAWLRKQIGPSSPRSMNIWPPPINRKGNGDMNNLFCCAEMEVNAGEELQIVHYNPVFDEYGVTIPEDGSVMLLRYCPWCGRKLPESKRDAWFDQLEALGYEDPLFRDDIPEAYQSDAWRK